MLKKLLVGLIVGSVCFPALAQQAATSAQQAGASASAASANTEAESDPRLTESLQKVFEKNPNFGPYETKLIYRQMLKSKHNQNNKTGTLKQMADTFKYDDSQLQQAADLYDNKQVPINYQISENQVNTFVPSIDGNPVQALSDLTSSVSINKAFLPQQLKKKAPEEETQAAASHPNAKPQAQQAQQSLPTGVANNNRRSVQSVGSISLRPTSGALTAKPKKRLGVKSYALNPDTFN